MIILLIYTLKFLILFAHFLLKISFFISFIAKTGSILDRFFVYVDVEDDIRFNQTPIGVEAPVEIEAFGSCIGDARVGVAVTNEVNSFLAKLTFELGVLFPSVHGEE